MWTQPYNCISVSLKRTPQRGCVHFAGGFLFTESLQRGGLVGRAVTTECGRRLHSKRESYGARGGPGEAENSVGLQAKTHPWGVWSLCRPSQPKLRQADLYVGNGVNVRVSTVGEGNGN